MSATTHHESRAVAAVAAAPRELLTLHLGTEQYGIDILRVQEIRRYEAPTRIAGAPAHVLGVIDLRGVVVPIVDLRTRLGLDAGFDAATVTVVLNVAARTVGAVVDAVSDVVALRPGDVRPAPAFAGGFDASHITGIATVGAGERARMLILVDVETLVGHDVLALGADASR